MANEKQLGILTQGVKVWKQWREELLYETIDLSGADLSRVDLWGADLSRADLSETFLREVNLREANLSVTDLRGADLRKADLSGADLSRAHLSRADLSEAHLRGADLRKANLSETDLRGADLRKADLSGADLSRADLSETFLREVNLREAHLSGAHLSGAHLIGKDLSGKDLSEADLRKADLRKADLSEADLSEADLSEADLRKADLSGAHLRKAHLGRAHLSGTNLSETDLSETDLSGANLNHANLGRANLRNATITGAYLYNTARDDWMIDGIICNYVYWDDKPSFSGEDKEQEKQWELTHRTPKDRDFRPGEFEELYKQLPTFEYYFEQGVTLLDIAFIDQVVNEIRELHPDWELKIDSIHSRGDPHSTFTIREKKLIKQAFTQIKTRYEEALNRLGGRYEEANKCLSEAIKALASSGGISINAKGDVTINAGGDVVGGNKAGGDIIKADVKGNYQHVAIGKNIQQQSREVLKGGTIDMRDTIKGDQINVSGGTVERIETGDKFYDHAQQLIQTVNAQSSQEDILNVLAAIQEGLRKLELPEAVKEEALNEVKGAEIQVKKEKPDKPKLVERLKNAQNALTGMENLGMKAVAIGNLLVKAIEWAEQLLT